MIGQDANSWLCTSSFQGRHPATHNVAAGRKIAVKCSMPRNFLHDLLDELSKFLDICDY
jgi:hypothetical protein